MKVFLYQDRNYELIFSDKIQILEFLAKPPITLVRNICQAGNIRTNMDMA